MPKAAASCAGRRCRRFSITCARMSRPARSNVRKVALLGRPMAGPVMASTSSIEYAAGRHGRQDARDLEQRQVIGDEIRRVLGDHHALAQALVGEPRHPLHHRGVGVGGRDHLEQPQVAGRVEEVRAQPVPLEALAAALGEGGDGNARGVGADDGVRAPGLVHLREQLDLRVQPLDNRLDHPIGVPQTRPALLEARGLDQAPGFRREERIGRQPSCALETRGRRLVRQIQQQRGHAGVGEVRGDLRAHDAGAKHGYGMNRHVWGCPTSMDRCVAWPGDVEPGGDQRWPNQGRGMRYRFLVVVILENVYADAVGPGPTSPYRNHLDVRKGSNLRLVPKAAGRYHGQRCAGNQGQCIGTAGRKSGCRSGTESQSTTREPSGLQRSLVVWE